MGFEAFRKLNLIVSERQVQYLADQEAIEFLCADEPDVRILQTRLKDDLALNSKDFYGNKVRVQIQELDYKLYWTLEDFNLDFFTDSEQSLQKKFAADTAIINYDSSGLLVNTLFYDGITKKTYINFLENFNDFLLSNAYYYLKFLQFLKKQENNEDGRYHFVDNFNWDNGTIIFVSPQKEGKMSLNFQDRIPTFDPEIDLRPRFIRFFDAFNENDRNQKLPKFIKAELFNKLSGETRDERLNFLIKILDQVLEVAEQNFDIYLSDLSIENVKKNYIETKDKNFAQMRESVGKLAGQVIALPITISAVALATYSIPSGNNRANVLLVLICVFLIYTFFSLFLLKIQSDDIDDNREEYIREFEKLSQSDFFVKFPEEITYFLIIKDKVINKINTIRYALYTYILLLTITNSILLYQLLVEINFYPVISIIVFEILIFVFLSAFTKSGRWVPTRLIPR